MHKLGSSAPKAILTKIPFIEGKYKDINVEYVDCKEKYISKYAA